MEDERNEPGPLDPGRTVRGPAADSHQASTDMWNPADVNLGKVFQPDVDWWRASDGRWYPPPGSRQTPPRTDTESTLLKIGWLIIGISFLGAFSAVIPAQNGTMTSTGGKVATYALGVAAGLIVVGIGCILRSVSYKGRALLNRPSGALRTAISSSPTDPRPKVRIDPPSTAQEVLAATTHHPGRFWTLLTALAVVVSFAVEFALHFAPGDYGTLPVYQLKVGDCIKGSLEDRGFRHSSCDVEHDAEIVAILTYSTPLGAPYPEYATLLDYSNPICDQAFSVYVGTVFSDSSLDADVFIPDSTKWDNGERRFICAALNAPGKHLIHTVRDSHL